MRKNFFSKVNLKKASPFLGVTVITLIMGVVIGAILYSNQIDQQIEVIDYEGAIDIVIVQDLSAGTFRDIQQMTTFNLTKNVENGLNTFAFYILVDHATEIVAVADVTLALKAYNTYMGATPYLDIPIIDTRQPMSGNMLHYFEDATGLLGIKMYCYYELYITFSSSAPSGSYTISIWCEDALPP